MTPPPRRFLFRVADDGRPSRRSSPPIPVLPRFRSAPPPPRPSRRRELRPQHRGEAPAPPRRRGRPRRARREHDQGWRHKRQPPTPHRGRDGRPRRRPEASRVHDRDPTQVRGARRPPHRRPRATQDAQDDVGVGPRRSRADKTRERLARCLAAQVRRSTTLVELELGADLGPAAMEILGKAIAGNVSLRRLSFADSNLGDTLSRRR